MRTSLNNVKAIDDYLFGRMTTGDALLFDANVLLNNDLTNDIEFQKQTHALVRQYSRQKIKEEIAIVQNIITNAPQHQGFMQRIANLFKTH